MSANVNAETGIPYGVIDARNVPDLMDEIFTNGDDLLDNADFDICDYGEPHEYSYTDSDGNRFLMGSLGGAPLIWVLQSDRIVRARGCSPCVPGAGDLDNEDPDGMECYGIPKSWLPEPEPRKRLDSGPTRGGR